MSEIKLSKRLSTAASYVRSGAFVADIGTDHAYLPIYLVSKGIARGALASDVNEGPILKAKENIVKYGQESRIFTQIANGLEGVDLYSPTDILICGMGGELIARIIEASSYVKNPEIRLILQPMTSVYELREYLSKGFSTVAENIVCEDGKIYQIICAEYDGQAHNYTKAELELGKINIENKSVEYRALLNSAIAKKQKKLDGIKLGGYDTYEVENELMELEKLKNDLL
ncbi:MAG: SAM-dependent methyltransferase [Ruminococcaceae bacterium]|nr:SAM-dependent methyltransferase [Oscillospiraceae bacterium]